MPTYDTTDFLDGTSLTVKVHIKDGNTLDLTGLKSIGYGTSVEKTKVKGTLNKYRGYTPGILSADDGSMELWVKEIENWILEVGTEEEFLLKEFDVTIAHRSAPGREVVTKKLKNCRIVSVARSHDFDSAENLTGTVNFSILSVE
jgi:hypothetical protein